MSFTFTYVLNPANLEVELRGGHPREALLWNSAGPDYRTGSGVMTVDLDL